MPPSSPRNADRLIANFAAATRGDLVDLALELGGVVPPAADALLCDRDCLIAGRAIGLALRRRSDLEETCCYVEAPRRLLHLDLALPDERRFALGADPWLLCQTPDLSACMLALLDAGREIYFPRPGRYFCQRAFVKFL